MIVEFREVRPGDAEALFATLRAREAERASLPEIKAAIADSIYTLVSTFDGKIASISGARLASMLDSRAYIWMLGTVLIDRHPITFARHSRRALSLLAERFGQIYGEVECDFTRSEKWLRWVGCDILPGNEKVKVWSWTR